MWCSCQANNVTKGHWKIKMVFCAAPVVLSQGRTEWADSLTARELKYETARYLPGLVSSSDNYCVSPVVNFARWERWLLSGEHWSLRSVCVVSLSVDVRRRSGSLRSVCVVSLSVDVRRAARQVELPPLEVPAETPPAGQRGPASPSPIKGRPAASVRAQTRRLMQLGPSRTAFLPTAGRQFFPGCTAMKHGCLFIVCYWQHCCQ